jgi:hypothetical protein
MAAARVSANSSNWMMAVSVEVSSAPLGTLIAESRDGAFGSRRAFWRERMAE